MLLVHYLSIRRLADAGSSRLINKVSADTLLRGNVSRHDPPSRADRASLAAGFPAGLHVHVSPLPSPAL